MDRLRSVSHGCGFMRIFSRRPRQRKRFTARWPFTGSNSRSRVKALKATPPLGVFRWSSMPPNPRKQVGNESEKLCARQRSRGHPRCSWSMEPSGAACHLGRTETAATSVIPNIVRRASTQRPTASIPPGPVCGETRHLPGSRKHGCTDLWRGDSK